jgi:hypothetical protein
MNDMFKQELRKSVKMSKNQLLVKKNQRKEDFVLDQLTAKFENNTILTKKQISSDITPIFSKNVTVIELMIIVSQCVILILLISAVA